MVANSAAKVGPVDSERSNREKAAALVDVSRSLSIWTRRVLRRGTEGVAYTDGETIILSPGQIQRGDGLVGWWPRPP
jgi:hypothetical protein